MVKIELKKIDGAGCAIPNLAQAMSSIQILPDGMVVDHSGRSDDQLVEVLKKCPDVKAIWTNSWKKVE